MPTFSIILTLIWIAVAATGVVIALLIVDRRGSPGGGWAGLAATGFAASYPLFHPWAFDAWVILVSTILAAAGTASCLALRRPRLSQKECWNCGYDFRGATVDSSTKCPECGLPRADMRGHCMECKADIQQAIAGGSDTCPYCGARIADLPRRMEMADRR